MDIFGSICLLDQLLRDMGKIFVFLVKNIFHCFLEFFDCFLLLSSAAHVGINEVHSIIVNVG